ncbi:MAG: dihydrofolate reductase [Puniceicoccaceae bacterium]
MNPVLSTRDYDLSAVVAMAENRVIGYQGKLPWHLPGDLKWFKRLTSGKTVIMGRKTYDSIGRPLPNRRNLVLSRQCSEIAGAEVFPSVDDILGVLQPDEEAFIIGGADIYKIFFPFCRKIFLTKVNQPYPGDTFLPPFEADFPVCEELDRQTDFTLYSFSRQ